MLTLSVTFFVAVYLLGPALVLRLVLGFFVSARTVVRSRSEEITWAVFVALVPFITSIRRATKIGVLRWGTDVESLQTYFAGAYSESYFKENAKHFFAASTRVVWINFSLLWRIYLQVLVFALLLLALTKLYSRIIKWRWVNRFWPLRPLLDLIVLQRISEWYLQFSNFTLDPNARLEVDVLTVSGTLYSGQLQSNIIGHDGRLAAIVLSEPRRFDRAPYLRLKEAMREPKVEDFWRDIPSESFLINGADISTINSRSAIPTDPDTLETLLEVISGEKTKRTLWSSIGSWIKNLSSK